MESNPIDRSNEDRLYEELLDLLSETTAYSRHQLTLETIIQPRCDGDDAVEMLEALRTRFNVDLSDFEFSKYFISESWLAGGPMIQLGCNPGEKMDLTVKDLFDAVRSGVWRDPDPCIRKIRHANFWQRLVGVTFWLTIVTAVIFVLKQIWSFIWR